MPQRQTPTSELAGVFRALSDPTRIRIIHALSLAELCNCDLASVLGLTESAISHQMRDLRLMKLVSAERRGRMVYYRLTDSHVRHIRAKFREVGGDPIETVHGLGYRIAS